MLHSAWNFQWAEVSAADVEDFPPFALGFIWTTIQIVLDNQVQQHAASSFTTSLDACTKLYPARLMKGKVTATRFVPDRPQGTNSPLQKPGTIYLIQAYLLANQMRDVRCHGLGLTLQPKNNGLVSFIYHWMNSLLLHLNSESNRTQVGCFPARCKDFHVRGTAEVSVTYSWFHRSSICCWGRGSKANSRGTLKATESATWSNTQQYSWLETWCIHIIVRRQWLDAMFL